MTSDNAMGGSQVETLQMVESTLSENGGMLLKGGIEHSINACGMSVCTYVFSVYNPSPVQTSATAQLTTFEVSHYTEETQDIQPGQVYENVVKSGYYIYYRVLNSMFNLEYVKTLTIDLTTFSGDADLFVSTTSNNTRPILGNYTYESRLDQHFDRV